MGVYRGHLRGGFYVFGGGHYHGVGFGWFVRPDGCTGRPVSEIVRPGRYGDGTENHPTTGRFGYGPTYDGFATRPPVYLCPTNLHGDAGRVSVLSLSWVIYGGFVMVPKNAEPEMRDAVHVPVMGCKCQYPLLSGANVRFIPGSGLVVEMCARAERDGVVDPFGAEVVLPGVPFWMYVEPARVNGFGHTFTLLPHPGAGVTPVVTKPDDVGVLGSWRDAAMSDDDDDDCHSRGC